MFAFFVAINTIGAVVSGIAFFVSLGDPAAPAMPYLILTIMCILNAIMFGKLSTMQEDILKIKKHIGIEETPTNDSSSSDSDISSSDDSQSLTDTLNKE